MQFMERLKPLGLLLLRIAAGAIFMFHGYPKLKDPAHWFRIFAGYGVPGYFVYVSGILELFGGGLLILGLFTRGIGLLLAMEMGIVLAHMGFLGATLRTFGEYELPLLSGAAVLALATTGAGLISIDSFTFESRRKATKKSKSKD
jgi:putative oxidoreductase